MSRRDPGAATIFQAALNISCPGCDSEGIARPGSPVAWYLLILEAEALYFASGWGLANVWGQIHSGDYEAARSALDEAQAVLAELNQKGY